MHLSRLKIYFTFFVYTPQNTLSGEHTTSIDKMKLTNTFAGYARLLLSANPSKKDVALLVTAIFSAVASGVPFPLIAIYFGRLLNDFNSASCALSSSSSSSSPEVSSLSVRTENEENEEEAYQSSANAKVLTIFILAIIQFLLVYTHLLSFSLFGARLSQRLREKYLSSLLRQEPGYFESFPSGEVASRLSGDIAIIRTGTSEKVGICLASGAFFITAYVVAFTLDVKLTGILVWLIPGYFTLSFLGGYFVEKFSEGVTKGMATAAGIAGEALGNVLVVQAFGAAPKLEGIYKQALGEAKREGLKKAVAVGIQSGVLYFLAYAANGLAFWQGSVSIAEAVTNKAEGVSVGETFTVIFVLVEATLLLSQVAPFIHLFSAAVASFRKLSEDMHRESQIDGTATSSGISLEKIEAGFELRDVCFTYPSRPDTVVLDHVNINIPLGKHTAIVGLSGSGKSTIAGLAMRLYDPTQGQIFFGGHDIRDLNVRNLRGYISLVQQEPSLLDRSLLENIAHGLTNSSNPKHAHLLPTLLGPDLADIAAKLRNGKSLVAAAEERGPTLMEITQLIRNAAILADADEFISRLPSGYGTQVGSCGRLLSGGQKQRVALARSLVKDPAVLILDEATAALDSQSEERIQKAIAKISVSVSDTNKTMLTIAHRLSTVTAADNIIVLQGGRVVEQGNHAALMEKNGVYAELVRLQMGAGSTPVSLKDGDSRDRDSIDSGSITTLFNLDKPSVALPSPTTPLSDENHNQGDKEGKEEDEIPSQRVPLPTLLRKYLPLLRPHLLLASLSLFASILVGASFSAEAVIFGNTVAQLSPCRTPSEIRSSGSLFGLLFLGLAIVELFANLTSWTCFGFISEKLVYNVRILAFRAMFSQDLAWFQSERRTPAGLLAVLTRDGTSLAGLSGSVIGTVFSISINLVVAIVLTHIIAWRVALVCLALVPLLLGAGVVELKILGRFEEKHQNAWARSVEVGTEAVAAIKTVAALGVEEDTLRVYRRELASPKKETLRVSVQASLCQALTYFLGNCVNALAYWWGAKQIIEGKVTTTQFLIVVFSLLVSALLWSQMFALAPELSSARAAMQRLLAVIELGRDGMRGQVSSSHPTDTTSGDEKTIESGGRRVSPNQAATVQFRQVHFSYPARLDTLVLRGLDLTIPPGTFCALVGPSGAGKSTVIALLERLYTPQSGSIYIDGIDVTKTSDVSFRDTIALVPQESLLFEGTVAFNIGLGAPAGHEATLEEIQTACRLASIHETISALPEGYETRCGPNGVHFSGGQKQRLSIARALIRKPRLLILDEPTSALDAESERLLQQGLEIAAKGITVVAIAHRLHTIKRADCIFLIEEGRVVDKGTHEDLFLRSETYRTNVLHQTVTT